LDLRLRNTLLVSCAALAATAVAHAQTPDPIGDLLGKPELPAAPQPYAVVRQTVTRPLSVTDQALFAQGLASAKRGDIFGAKSAISSLSDPVARKVVTWAMVDVSSNLLGFYDLDAARRDLDGFPRGVRRQIAAEKLLETAGKTPAQIVDWFAGQEPQCAQGAMALASAYRSLGRQAEASDLIRRWWRDKSFEADVQRTMLTRFADVLTVDDHVRRADVLLYGAQGPAARDVVALLPAEKQPAALARLSLRGNVDSSFDTLSPADQASPGVAFERAAFLRRKGLDGSAVAALSPAATDAVTADAADRVWDERYRLTLASIRNGDWRAAYRAAANTGLNSGADATEAEFYAGWIALKRLNEPATAARHFAAIERIGSSPITRARAFYWQGRAAEAQGDKTAAENFYSRGAEHITTFYGQLSAEKLGLKLVLPADPVPTPADRASFEGRDVVQAMRLLADQNQRDLFKVFALHLDDIVPSRVDAALLIDAVRGYGDQDTSMKAARGAAQRGLILADRAYPLRTPPQVLGAPEPALVLGITRQESGFDPGVRSGADARGMMQLLPSTAAVVARRMGVGYSASMLYEPDYNMRLGSSFLGSLVNQFSGSYIMAAAGYNAGPGRPPQWTAMCGDPRAGGQDPLDFIECIPFSETRNYVMRVMENMQVYRAKLNGGTAPITLSNDLRRGGYNYAPQNAVVASTP